MKRIFTLIFFSILTLTAQNVFGQLMSIHGRLNGNFNSSDTIFFIPNSEIPSTYYEEPLKFSTKIKNNSLEVTMVKSYPQLYYSLLDSDIGELLYRPGIFFVDSLSSEIVLDLNHEESNSINGNAGLEYKSKFQPFIRKHYPNDSANNSNFFYTLFWNKNPSLDTLLYSYVKENPSSYVALWHVIQRFYRFGHFAYTEKILNSFSIEIRNSKIGQLIISDFSNALLKEYGKFPNLELQNINLKKEVLKIPKNKVVVIDFWFSNCKPCIASFPRLKQLYSKNRDKGLEIISISTDRSDRIENWKNRITEHHLDWKQYLDEDGLLSTQMMIKMYPTYVLIDPFGNIVNNDISIDDLEKYFENSF